MIYGLAKAVISNGHPLGLPLNQTTIADELKKGGYATHSVGKWDLGMYKWEYAPTYRGFDSFYGYYDGSENYFNHSVKAVELTEDKKENVSMCGVGFRNNTELVINKL